MRGSHPLEHLLGGCVEKAAQRSASVDDTGVSHLTCCHFNTRRLSRHWTCGGSATLGAGCACARHSFDLAQLDAVAMGGAATALQLDVTDECSLALAVSEVATRFGRLDVLVNHAAVSLDHHESISRLKNARP